MNQNEYRDVKKAETEARKAHASYLEALGKMFKPKDDIRGRFVHRSKIQRRSKKR